MTRRIGSKPTTAWDGRARNANWFNAANWTNGIPQAGTKVFFNDTRTQSVGLGHRSAVAGRMEVSHATLTLTNGVLDLEAGRAAPDLSIDKSAGLTIAGSAAVITRGDVAVGQLTNQGMFSAGALTVQGYLSASTVDDLSGIVTVAAGGTLDASVGLDITPIPDLGQVSPLGTLAIAGVVHAGAISGAGLITEAGPGADLTGNTLATVGTLAVAGGATATIGSIELGSAMFDNLSGLLSVMGAGSTVTVGQITVSGDANGALSVTGGATLDAAAIITTANESNASIAIAGAGSSIDVGTLAMGGLGNIDTLSITQGASLTVGAGGMTVDLSAFQLDSTARLTLPSMTSLAGTIDAVAGGGGVSMSAAVTLGLDTVTGRGQTTFTAGAGAELTVSGAVSGQAGSSLVVMGDVALTNAANVLPQIGFQSGTLEIAATGAAGLGTITFLNPGPSAVLQVDAGVTLGNTIAGFGGADAIDLQGFAFNANIMETLQGGTLTLNNGTQSASLVFAGNYTTEQFVLQTDQHGGTLITFHT